MLNELSLGRSSRRGAEPPRGLAFWLFAALLLFSPLPFASIYETWPALYGVLLPVAALAYLVERWQTRRPISLPPPLVLIASALLLGVILWAYLQSTPGLALASQHPVWQDTRALLNQPHLPGALSVAPERSRIIATHYLAYLVFAWVAFWQCRRSRNQQLLLKLFVAAQAVYAVYGLTVYFGGFETILWFDKTAYRGVLTATFINRNSYATYAGLGTLAALALMLGYLRRLLGSDADPKARLREFIETLTTTGWLPVLAAVACFLALLLTQSRMGLVAFLVGVVVLLLGWSLRLPAGRSRGIGLGLLSVPVALLVMNLLLSGDQTAERFSRLFEQGDGRFDVYPLILQAIDERPWTGYGLGSFEPAFRLVRDETIGDITYTRGHCDYLELIMDLGWPAAIAIVTAVALLFVAGLRVYFQRAEFEAALLFVAATVQIAIHSSVDFSMQMPAVVLAYLFLAGLAFGGAARRYTPSS